MDVDNTFDVVISGISGRFPECDNVELLLEELQLDKSLITLDNRRWNAGSLGVDAHVGKVPDPYHFDNQFFGMHRPLTTETDAMTRLTLERVVEALMDAGLHPFALNGTNTAVFASCTLSQHETAFTLTESIDGTGFGIMGRNRSMAANRISFFLNLHGRSCAYDGTWAWAACGLQMAYDAIKSGECEVAILTGASLSVHAEVSASYDFLNILSPDGVCRPFDADGKGIVRSESQVAFLLQRSDRAKRAHAKVLGARMMYDDDMRRDLISPSVGGIARVAGTLYEDMGIDRKRVKYVECDGTGFQPTDYAELEGLSAVLCKDRKEPLLIGSVKGHVGHTEGSSGMVSIVKALSVLNNGIIPRTLNTNKLNPKIPSLKDGRLKVVQENTPITIDDDTVVGLTFTSFSGTVGHVALGPGSRSKVIADPVNEIPRLILISARSQEEMQPLLKKISNVPFDPEYYRLVQDIFAKPIRGYECRAHVVCPVLPETHFNIEITGKKDRPVWFVFSGMGSQWPQMGRDLLRLPVFAATIDRCHAVLESKGLNLRQILTHPKQDIFDDILNSFVGIAAVQVGLINIMRLLEIKPDGFIGHSVGEQACAYADGCISEEQTILAAYARGMASKEATLIKGMMAAVGIGYQNIKGQLPECIEVACHNSKDSCTISGPAEEVTEYVQNLKKNNVFARTVNVSDTAYHSRYIKDAGPFLLRRLSEVIKEPTERSSRWISTSSPKELWRTRDARFCSAQYLTNNLLRPVLFEEAMEHVPDDAILIEIAPHGLLQAILQRSSPQGSTNISLTKRGTADGLRVLYDAIGKMYLAGLCPQVANLYPKIEFPVSRETPSTAGLASWLHTEEFICKAEAAFVKEDCYEKITISLETPSETLRGNLVCSGSYYLRVVWTMISKMRRLGITNQKPLEFQGVRYLEPLNIASEGSGKKSLHLTIQPVSGTFEVMDDEKAIVTGRILTVFDDEEKTGNRQEDFAVPRGKSLTIIAQNVYAELAARGNSYHSDLMAIDSILTCDDNWIAKVRHGGDINAVFAAIFQLVQLHGAQESQICTYPEFLQRLRFNPKKFFAACPEVAEITFFVKLNRIVSTGLTLEGLNFRPMQVEAPKDLQLQASSLEFIPFGTNSVRSTEELASVALQLTLENQTTTELTVTVLELSNGTGNIFTVDGSKLHQMASDNYNVQIKISKMTINGHGLPEKLPTGVTTTGIILCGASTASAAVALLEKFPKAMILVSLRSDDIIAARYFRHLKVLGEHVSDSESCLLLGAPEKSSDYEVIMVPKSGQVPQSLNLSTRALYVWTAITMLEIKSVVDEITNLPGGRAVRMVFILDKDAPEFSTSHPLYRQQLELGMRLNILQSGLWGSLKVLPLPQDSHQTPNGQSPLQKVASTTRVEGTNISHWGLEEATTNSMSQELGLDYCGRGPKGHIFGVAKAINGVPQLDPKLQWVIPTEWTPAEAATIPLAYCQAYYALHCRTQIQPNNVILVTEPMRPEGEAAVRVALASEHSSQVYTIVRSGEEKKALADRFSDAIGVEKLHLLQLDHHTLYNIFMAHAELRRRVDIIVTLKPEDITTDVLFMFRYNGRCVHLGSAHTTMKHQFGLLPFLRSVAVLCVTVQSILHMQDDDKHAVHSAIAKGLKPSGFVRPLLRYVRRTSAIVQPLWKHRDAINKKVVLKVRDPDSPTMLFKTGSTCLITKATPQQTILLANWSARRGITNIVVIGAQPHDTFILRHAHLLRSIYGATIHFSDSLHDGLQQPLKCGTLALIFAVVGNDFGHRSAETLTKVSAAVPLIVLSANELNNGVLADSCVRRQRSGRQTLLLLGPMNMAVETRVLDWLLRAEKPPVITLLRTAQDLRTQRILAARPLKLLPNGAEPLGALGRSFLQHNQTPCLIEIPTNGPNHSHAREVFPLFVVPGFAASIHTVLRPLAKKLLAPLVCVRLPEDVENVVDIARDVAKVIKGRQRNGPYTLLGFDWTVCLTRQVAVELRSSGSAATVFLIDGIYAQEVARLRNRPDVDGLLLSECLNLQINSSRYADVSALSTWKQKVHHLSNTLGDERTRVDVERALNFIRQWIAALAKHQVSSCDVDTHLIETSSIEDIAFSKTSRLKVFRCIETHYAALSSAKLQNYINDNMGSSSLQTTNGRIERGMSICDLDNTLNV